MRRHLLASVLLLIALTAALGFGYPLIVTGLAELAFGHQANGSLVYRHGKLVGSSLLGQGFAKQQGQPAARLFPAAPVCRGVRV